MLRDLLLMVVCVCVWGVQSVRYGGGGAGRHALHGGHAAGPRAAGPAGPEADLPGESQDQHPAHQEGQEGRPRP